MSREKSTRDSHGKEHPRKVGTQFAERARARKRALQALYQWQLTDQTAETIVRQFNEEQDMSIADSDYFKDLVLGVEREQAEIDQVLQPFLDRPIAQVDPIERAVLRLAKDFGTEGGHTYVNGVLDKAIPLWRAVEWQANSKKT
jgi:transcription antitermination protein NusB